VTFTSTKAFPKLPNITDVYNGLVQQYENTLGGGYLRIFISYFLATQPVANVTTQAELKFEYLIYYNSTQNANLTNSVFIDTINVLTSVTEAQVSDSTIKLQFDENLCAQHSSGISAGEAAGIAVGVVAGSIVAVSAVGGLTAAAYFLIRYMNRAPLPEQLISGDNAFMESAANDNTLFTSNTEEFQNELYAL